jgi:tRNA-Thr(GGU) m(6)t(6)A37 methyltransferase TsaA
LQCGRRHARLPLIAYTFDPIGVVRSPYLERADAPRQPTAARGVAGSIELFAGRGFEDALEDVSDWEYVWVLFVFHRNVEDDRGWRPKVLPPRSTKKRGVFATRSPHRPNPIGMSVVRLAKIEGLTLHVTNVDLLDGTPVLDIKPYVPYADAYPDAKGGWLDDAEQERAWEVTFSAESREQLAWLSAAGCELEAEITTALALGPQPHAYRRIRKDGDSLRLAFKEWRVRFHAEGRSVVVERIVTGYRPREIATGAAPAIHAAFVTRFEA